MTPALLVAARCFDGRVNATIAAVRSRSAVHFSLAGECRNRNNEKPRRAFRRVLGAIDESRRALHRGGFAFLGRGVSLLNGDGQLALQSGFFFFASPFVASAVQILLNSIRC